jgi:DNA topoisomerase-3
MTGRKLDETEIRQLVSSGEVGPLDGFVSPRTGNRFPAKLRLVDDVKNEGKRKVELDFGNKFEINELTPFWTDPKTGAELCEAPTSYVLREREGDTWKQAFSVGRSMCQKPITREHAIQFIEAGKTELIKGFISKKGRPFDAFLLRAGPKITWEFPPRAPKVGKDGKVKERKAKAPLDLSKATKLGTSKAHDADLYETEDSYVVAKPSGADNAMRTVFELKKLLCQKELPADEILRMLDDGKTNLIEGFVSKRGSNFSAYLTLSKDKKKAEFEFPPR